MELDILDILLVSEGQNRLGALLGALHARQLAESSFALKKKGAGRRIRPALLRHAA